jgi:hypothetical protein
MIDMLQFNVASIFQGLLPKSATHKLNNWLDFWHFCVRQWGGFMLHVKPLLYLYHLFIILSCQYLICLSWKCLQKFNMEELVNMPTCNLLEITIHNIWLQ